MSGKYRLALDIQTTSIGWALWNLNKDNSTQSLKDCGVRIFSEGREPVRNGKTGDSLAVQRRISRQIRKMRRRNKRRKHLVVNELVRNGLLPQDKNIRMLLKNTHPDCIEKHDAQKNREWNPYYLRFQALERKLYPYELGRVITHLMAHRGYRSNGSESISEQNLERKKNLLKIKELEGQIVQSSCRTLGEFLWHRVEHNYHIDSTQEEQEKKTIKRETIRFKPDMVHIFPSRQMYLDEYNAIRKKQEEFFPHLPWDRLQRIMYHQRPLKIIERSFCPYYSKTERRAFRSQPSAHRFRIMQLLSTLTYIDDNDSTHFLTGEQQDVLFSILESQKTLSYTEAAKRIGLPIGGYFSIENRKNQKLLGNETVCDMRKAELFGTLWDTFDETTQDIVIHQLITSDKEDALEAFVGRFPISLMQKKNILNYTFKGAIAPYSARLMRECVALMRAKHVTFDESIKELYLYPIGTHEENIFDMLPYYGQVLPDIVILPPKRESSNPEIIYGKIWNPSIHIVLNQIRILTNALIARYGKPSFIHLHIANEVKKSKDGRDALSRSKLFADTHYNEMREHVKNSGHLKEISSWQYTAIKLWKELAHSEDTEHEHLLPNEKRICVYCGKPISIADIFSNQAGIGYILPFSYALINTLTNMTLAHISCLERKGAKTPFQAFGTNPEEWHAIHERAKHFPVQKRVLFRSQDIAQAQVPYIAVFPLSSSLGDNSFFARKFTEYLACICPKSNISVFSKNLPSLLHIKWKLHTILGKTHNAAPNDYRSRVLDACILGSIDKRITEQLQTLNAEVWMPQKIQVPPFIIPIATIVEQLQKVVVSHKPDHSLAGKLFDETAMGKHMYTEQVSFESITQDDVSLLQSKRLRETAHVLLEAQGWKRTKGFLFEKHKSLPVSRSYYVTRKKIISCSDKDTERIIDHPLSLRVQKISANRQNESERRKALDDFVQNTGIRRIRIIPKGQEVIPIASSSNKAYAPADFLFVDIWATLHKDSYEYRGVFVSRFDAYKYMKEDRKPHPAAKYICRLFKNDILKIKSDLSTVLYARVAGFATTQQKIDIRPIYAVGTIPQWVNSISPMMTQQFWIDKKSPQNHMAINSIFSGQFAVQKVSVTPDGKVR